MSKNLEKVLALVYKISFMEYKGLVINNNGESYLFYEKEDKTLSDGFPITDSDGIYKDLKDCQINFCKVQFCDGTVPMKFESFKNLDDIFFKIKDLAVISIFDKEKESMKAILALKEDGSEMAEYFFSQPIFD